MANISINLGDDGKIIAKTLQDDIIALGRKGINIDVAVRRLGDVTFLDCSFGQKIAEECQKELAAILATTMVNDFGIRYIPGLLNRNYGFLKTKDKKTICKRALQVFFSNIEIKNWNSREIVESKISSFLRESANISLAGFIRFRLQNFVEIMKESVGKAVDDYLAEKEYLEFIRLLRYFVDIQEPKTGLVNIYFYPPGRIRITNEDDVPLTENYMEETLQTLMAQEVDVEDVLISTLITIAPEKIVLHAKDDCRVKEAVSNIFGDRVQYCLGCALCRSIALENSKKSD